MEICENCYDEVSSVVRVQGMDCCRSCIKELKADKVSVEEDAVMMDDDVDDILGIMSDDDVLAQYSEIASFNADYDFN